MKPYLYLLFCFLSLSTSLSFAEEPIEFLRKLVEINSGTDTINGVNRVQDLIAERLKALGFQNKFTSNPLGSEKSGKLLVGSLAGKNRKFITLVLHADTVFESSSEFKGLSVSSDGKIARGPGVIDDKGGVVVVIEGLERFLKTQPIPYYSLRVVVSPSEETGSEGFLEQFKLLAQDSHLVLGFEPALDQNTIINSRQGNRWYHIKVTGREAHAGRAHKDGVNACLDLSQKLYLISKLTDYKKDVTVSIGSMRGGKDKFNIVCGTAEAKVDVRFSSLLHRDEIDKKIQSILKKPLVQAASKNGEKTQTETRIEDDCPAFSPLENSRQFVEKYQRIISQTENIQVKSDRSGGAADSNYFAHGKTPILDGLGAVGGGMHTHKEFIVVSSLKTRATALANFLTELNQAKNY